jgi:hypothetical protein
MATLWIHRATAADVLVDFEKIEYAYNFTIKFMHNYSDSEVHMTLNDLKNYPASNEPPCFAATTYLQISVLPLGVNPNPFWNNSGFVKVSPEEAVALGEYKNPIGFIPFESDRIWTKETRSIEELDAELDNYMYAWRDVSKFSRRKIDF